MYTDDIGAFIKERRISKKLTQADVAEQLHVSPQAVSKWERSECLPDIALLPHIAELLDVTVDGILKAGDVPEIFDLEETLRILNRFVDENVYMNILRQFEQTDDVRELTIPFEIFVLLSNPQKETLLDRLLAIDDYTLVVDDVFLYLNTSQREKIIKDIIDRKDFVPLETLIPFMTKAMKSLALEHALDCGEYEFLEGLFPFLNREQKDWFVQYTREHSVGQEILENFVPFLRGTEGC